jgi:hypothetical protein
MWAALANLALLMHFSMISALPQWETMLLAVSQKMPRSDKMLTSNLMVQIAPGT